MLFSLAGTRSFSEQKEFLVTLLGLRSFRRCAHFLNFRIASASHILVSRFYDYIALLTQGLQIITQRLLHPRRIQLFPYFMLYFLARLHSLFVFLHALQTHNS